MLRYSTTISALTLCSVTLLGACGGDSGPGYAIHDTKYKTTPEGCVEDTATGLVWEVKSDQPGLHDWRNTYSWYNPEQAHGELDYRGTSDGGECADSACDTWEYVIAVNQAGLCAHSDWRMPSRDELNSISDLRKAVSPPTANMDYFPHMQTQEYWSAHDYSFQPDAAWGWSFQFGHDRVDWKRSPKLVRLVRGEASGLIEVKE
jgi:hypothetical protein